MGSLASPTSNATSSSSSPVVDLSWAKVGQVSELEPRFGHTLTVVPSPSGPKVYAIGGQGFSGAPLPPRLLVQALEPSLVSWAPIPLPAEPPTLPKLLARTGHASAVVDRTIVTFGGIVGGRVTNDLVLYDTATTSWEVNPADIKGVAPPARCGHTATAVGNAVFFVGGRSSAKDSAKPGGVFSDVWVLDWTRKTWFQPDLRGYPPPSLHSHSAVLLPPEQERIVIFGGISQPGTPQGAQSDPSAKGGASAADQSEPTNEIWVLEVDTALVRTPVSSPSPSKGPTAPAVPGTITSNPKFAVAWSKGALGTPPRPVVICGPSGVGKGTLIAKLMADFPEKCGFSVSHTTRKARPGETDGVHYHFSSRPDMEKEIKAGRFLEKADVHGNLYGTSVGAVKKVAGEGKMCILDIDVQGARQVKQSPHVSAVFIFVAPPSFEELEKRLRGRGTETEEQIQKRLRNAKAELESGSDTSLFNHRIVNDDLEAAYTKLKDLLGLGASTQTQPSGPTLKARHLHASAATVGGHIILHGGLGKDEKPVQPLQVICASKLTGGAPGVTRGFSLARLSPPPAQFWELGTLLSTLGLGKAEEAHGERDGDPTPARSSHQAVNVGPSQVLLAGGRLQDGVATASHSVVLSIEDSS